MADHKDGLNNLEYVLVMEGYKVFKWSIKSFNDMGILSIKVYQMLDLA